MLHKKRNLKTVSRSIPKITKTVREQVIPSASSPFIQLTSPPALPLYIVKNYFSKSVDVISKSLHKAKRAIQQDSLQEAFLKNQHLRNLDTFFVHKFFV